MTTRLPPAVLAIAGSDPSGGAGIQADLKTFSALGAYGMAAMTALTAQNTRGVRGVHAVPPAFLREQVDAVFDDIRVDAVKIGMVGSAESVAAVADALERRRPGTVVLDPVMVAKSGDRLVDTAAVDMLRRRLLPLADLVTPNLPEAAVLLGDDATPADDAAVADAGERLLALGPAAALVKGGHLSGPTARDLLCRSGSSARAFDAPRVATPNSHGTGCTLSSAIAALAPRADDMAHAVGAAKAYLTHALEAADTLGIGAGHGPVHHFARAWSADPAAAWLAAAGADGD